MSKRVEFHQAEITVTVRVVDDERSYGARRFSLALLLDTDAEWTAARRQIRETIEGLNANSDQTPT